MPRLNVGAIRYFSRSIEQLSFDVMPSQAERTLAAIGEAAAQNPDLANALQDSFGGDIINRLNSNAEAVDEPDGPGGAVTREEFEEMSQRERHKHIAAGGYVQDKPMEDDPTSGAEPLNL